jgi:hypothetical protein
MATCVSCHDHLILELEPEDEDEEDVEMGESSATGEHAPTARTVPDDVHLNCGCHFHW